MAIVFYSGYTVRHHKTIKKHCTLMRITVGLLLVTTFAVMLTTLVNFTRYPFFSWLFIESWIHHVMGLILLLIFIYANLVSLRLIKVKQRMRRPMWIATAAWFLSFVMGVHNYVVMWV
jgi:hypothetical protein